MNSLFAILSLILTTVNGFSPNSNAEMPKMKCTPLIQDAEKFQIDTEIKFTVKSAKIEESNLIAEIEYTGSGKEKFNCYWTGIIMKSYPPKTNLSLKIEKSKAGTKTITQKVCIDLSEMAAKYQKSGIFLILQGWEGQIPFGIKTEEKKSED